MPRPVQLAEKPPRYSLAVQSVELLADEVYRVRLDPHPCAWTPGDCVTLHAPGADAGRPYSFSGPPDAAYCEFWIRRFAGGRVSHYLTGLPPGKQVEVSPPFGWFRPLEPVDSPKIYLATGTGIAPFLSALSCRPEHVQKLLWGMRRDLTVPEIFSGVEMVRCISRERVAGTHPGRMTDLISQLDLSAEPHLFLCGLDDMIEEVTGLIRARGVPAEHLHTECFFTADSSSAS